MRGAKDSSGAGAAAASLIGRGSGAATRHQRVRSSAPTAIRLLLVEQEMQVRTAVGELCGQSASEVRLISAVQRGAEAFQAAQALRPDVILLGTAFPDMSGLAVLQSLRDQHRRRTILLTRTMQQRIDALGAGALDFLTVPIEVDAFRIAMARVRGRFGVRKIAPADGAFDFEAARLQNAATEERRPFVLIAEREHRLFPLQPRQIDYVQSEGNYVKIHVGKTEYIARESIKRLAVVLSRAGFLRVERTVLLNVLAISFIETIGRGAFAFTLAGGARFTSGFAFREGILRALPLRRRAIAVTGTTRMPNRTGSEMAAD